MKGIFFISMVSLLIACNNAGKDKETTTGDSSGTTTNVTSTSPGKKPASNLPAAGSATVSYTVEDTARNSSGSILVSKDKAKLSPGHDYLAIITVNRAAGESFNLNFIFGLQPGSYPVVGYGFTRPKQVFGGLLGGKPRITKYKVNLTEVTNIGSNDAGGPRWKLAGTVDEEITIPAMGIMKMDKTHPAEIKVNKISFANLTFDDNWDELVGKALEKTKKN